MYKEQRVLPELVINSCRILCPENEKILKRENIIDWPEYFNEVSSNYFSVGE
jgi:hypothetical protein